MENSHSMTRRAFINRTALGVAAVALTPFNSLIAANPQSTWAKNASKYNMIMIGHGHIDPVWLWRWQEGVAVVHSTFRSALDRMKENPDMFVLNHLVRLVMVKPVLVKDSVAEVALHS